MVDQAVDEGLVNLLDDLLLIAEVQFRHALDGVPCLVDVGRDCRILGRIRSNQAGILAVSLVISAGTLLTCFSFKGGRKLLQLIGCQVIQCIVEMDLILGNRFYRLTVGN